MPGRAVFAVWLVLVPALLTAACGGGSGETPAASATLEATATLPTIPPSGIREQDPTSEPGLREFLVSSGGQVEPERITYADLTEDGGEEAVVPVSSGGEGGDIAVFVIGYESGELRELLRFVPERSLTASVTDGDLTVTEPIFAPGDALCCPSQLRNTTYRWDGSQLAVAAQETRPAEGN